MPGRTPTTSSTGASFARAGDLIFAGHLTRPRASSATCSAVIDTFEAAFAEAVGLVVRSRASEARSASFVPHAVMTNAMPVISQLEIFMDSPSPLCAEQIGCSQMRLLVFHAGELEAHGPLQATVFAQ